MERVLTFTVEHVGPTRESHERWVVRVAQSGQWEVPRSLGERLMENMPTPGGSQKLPQLQAKAQGPQDDDGSYLVVEWGFNGQWYEPSKEIESRLDLG